MGISESGRLSDSHQLLHVLKGQKQDTSAYLYHLPRGHKIENRDTGRKRGRSQEGTPLGQLILKSVFSQ